MLFLFKIGLSFLLVSSVLTTSCPQNKWTYKWTCEKTGKCIRYHSDKLNDESKILWDTQNICRLSCGRYGSIWPRPSDTTLIAHQIIQFNPNLVRFDLENAPDETKEYLNDVKIYFIDILMKECKKNCTSQTDTDIIIKLNINKNDLTLNWETDESYGLNITTSGTHVIVHISAETVYGARHGIETLSQLIALKPGPCNTFSQTGLVIVTSARIRDRPMFPHRGLMIDTARNFIPLVNIRKTLDGMASSKLNVFHWHATDSQSFPLEIVRIPQMTRYGAYSAKNIYKKNDVIKLIKYAKIRGIRVIIELDAPSHAGNGWQWGPSAGLGDLAVCVNEQPWRDLCIQPPCGQLNPANLNLYSVIRDVYKDIIDYLPEGETMHMGGDEVFFGCWNSSTEIVKLLKDRGHGREQNDFLQLWAEYQSAVLRIWDEESGVTSCSRTEECKKPTKVILWSSHLTDHLHIEEYLQKDRYIIQTWVESSNELPMALVAKGYDVIMSTKNAWYLDHGFWGVTDYYSWRTVYKNRIPKTKGILGGETCMWSEYVDEHSLDSRVWPRAAAAAERMWTDPETDATTAEPRFYRHRERLVDRGLTPESIAPKYCIQNEGECT